MTSVPCQVVRSTTQVYFNIRIDQKRRRAIHFCEQCRYYGRYCDAIHKGRKINRKHVHTFDERYFSISVRKYFRFSYLSHWSQIGKRNDEREKKNKYQTMFFVSIQDSVDRFPHRWHAYRSHRKFPNRISISFLKNVIQLNKYSNIFNSKFDKNLPIPRLSGH